MTEATRLSLPAPAKLNLMLHITGRRPDGYHNLQTIFQFLDYGDQLDFQTRNDGQLTLTPEIPGVPRESNLIIRAARALQSVYARHYPAQVVPGANIYLKKILPMGGGLGGGSSDAATTLLALNHLWQLELPLPQLAAIGLHLGADVPVFVNGYAAFAEGVGEELTPLPDLDEPWYLVACPPVEVNTGKIFSHELLTRNSPVINIRLALEQGGRNDCQQVVTMLYPEVDKALNLLNKFSQAKMTGTGACVFAAFDSEAKAISAFEQVPAELPVFVAKGANCSCAHRLLFRPS